MSEVVKNIEDSIAKTNADLQQHTAKLGQIEKARKQLKAEHEMAQATINVHNGALQAFNIALAAAKAVLPVIETVAEAVLAVEKGAK